MEKLSNRDSSRVFFWRIECSHLSCERHESAGFRMIRVLGEEPFGGTTDPLIRMSGRMEKSLTCHAVENNRFHRVLFLFVLNRRYDLRVYRCGTSLGEGAAFEAGTMALWLCSTEL